MSQHYPIRLARSTKGKAPERERLRKGKGSGKGKAPDRSTSCGSTLVSRSVPGVEGRCRDLWCREEGRSCLLPCCRSNERRWPVSCSRAHSRATREWPAAHGFDMLWRGQGHPRMACRATRDKHQDKLLTRDQQLTPQALHILATPACAPQTTNHTSGMPKVGATRGTYQKSPTPLVPTYEWQAHGWCQAYEWHGPPGKSSRIATLVALAHRLPSLTSCITAHPHHENA